MKCATHPDVETNLRCGKCDKPICPKCMVQTPVGARCRDCAQLYKLPTYSVSTRYYLRAVGTGLGMAIACGLVWGVVGGFLRFFLLSLVLAAGAGYAIGEVISLSVNRKRGAGLAVIAGGALVASYLVSLWFVSFLFGIPFSLVLPLSLFNIIFTLVSIALGIYVAVTRLR